MIELTEVQQKHIEELLLDSLCSRECECYQSGFKDLCKAKDIGMEDFLECAEEDANMRPSSFSFGYRFFCKCPIRIYISREFGI